MKTTLILLLAALAASLALAPGTASATHAGPCVYVIEDADCIDPTDATRPVCAAAEKLGWYCVDATAARSAGTRQCTQVDGVEGCLESIPCGTAYTAGQAVNALLRKAGVPLGLPPFYCTM